MNLSRRIFLRNGAFALASVGTLPLWGPAFLQRTILANEPSRKKKILICIFQRGAADGLSMVVPFGDPHYFHHRKEIAIPQPAKEAAGTASLDLDGYFGLHPSLAPFLPLFQTGQLAIIHACGSPNNTRSHFDAQDFMESGVADNKSIHNGWLNRALLCCPEDQANATPFRSISMTPMVPRTLQGELETLAIPDLRTFGVGKGGKEALTGTGTASSFESIYAGAVDQVLHGTGKESFGALSMLKKMNVNQYRPEGKAAYPPGAFGRSLMQIAQLIKSDLGVEVAFAESGGWDTHANQGAATGALANKLTEFSKAIAALYTDLGDRMNDIVLLTMSEFGRAARQNGNRGTDHGHATCFFALGGGVKGGRVLGKWPGLAPEQLFENRDLAVTTDYRNVFAEITSKHLGALRYEKIFPDFDLKKSNFLKLLG